MDDCRGAQTIVNSLNKSADYNQNTGLTSHNGFYTLSGILDFLQSEWSRMEMERSEWEVERAELQARIAFLQGERKGQENLKSDLVRRIKMLEYALLQERSKNFELKYPNESKSTLNAPQLPPEDYLSDSEKTSSKTEHEAARWREERAKLKEYLVNAGLGDAMEQLKRFRIRDLLSMPALSQLNGTDQSDTTTPVNMEQQKNTQFPSGTFSSDANQMELSSSENPQVVSTGSVSSVTSGLESGITALNTGLNVTDPETAEALAEFEMLVAQQRAMERSSMIGEQDSFELSSIHIDNLLKDCGTPEICRDWDSLDEKEMLARFKEQYRADRCKVIKPGAHSSRAPGDLQHQPPSDDVADPEFVMSSLLAGDIDVKRPTINNRTGLDPTDPSTFLVYHDQLPGKDETVSPSDELLLSRGALSPTASGLSRPSGSNTTGSATLGLGDLASLTVANESDVTASHARAAVAAAMDNLDGVGDLMALRNAGSGMNTTTPLASATAVSPASTKTASAAEPPSWTAKYTLRSHFDAIRAVAFHSTEPALVTASEDHTLKLWNLSKTVQAKKSTSFDVEPIFTFRGHDSPVLSLAIWPAGPADMVDSVPGTNGQSSHVPSSTSSPLVIFSGDLWGQLRCWRLPGLQMDPYDSFDPNVIGPVLQGHKDAIWSLSTRPDGNLLSASSDGTACFWSTASLIDMTHTNNKSMSASKVYQLTTSLMAALMTRSVELGSRAPVPTSIRFSPADPNRFISGFTSGHIGLFDLETSQLITTFHSTPGKTESLASVTATTIAGDVYPTRPALTNPGSVTCLVTHPHQTLVISAHEDSQIRFYDMNSGKCVHAMVAHLDAVTALAIDPQGTYLLSASHDCSIRLWNINKKTCTQEITSHRKKFGEAIHAVAFHPTKHYMASAGADALAKVFV